MFFYCVTRYMMRLDGIKINDVLRAMGLALVVREVDDWKEAKCLFQLVDEHSLPMNFSYGHASVSVFW